MSRTVDSAFLMGNNHCKCCIANLLYLYHIPIPNTTTEMQL